MRKIVLAFLSIWQVWPLIFFVYIAREVFNLKMEGSNLLCFLLNNHFQEKVITVWKLKCLLS